MSSISCGSICTGELEARRTHPLLTVPTPHSQIIGDLTNVEDNEAGTSGAGALSRRG